jgi:hypothetical protein
MGDHFGSHLWLRRLRRRVHGYCREGAALRRCVYYQMVSSERPEWQMDLLVVLKELILAVVCPEDMCWRRGSGLFSRRLEVKMAKNYSVFYIGSDWLAAGSALPLEPRPPPSVSPLYSI